MIGIGSQRNHYAQATFNAAPFGSSPSGCGDCERTGEAALKKYARM
jgi:hypothetical protein